MMTPAELCAQIEVLEQEMREVIDDSRERDATSAIWSSAVEMWADRLANFRPALEEHPDHCLCDECVCSGCGNRKDACTCYPRRR
mgnify:CR=1 FL=1